MELMLNLRWQYSLKVLLDAIHEYQPSHVFGMFSGGHDSLCAVSVASVLPNFSGAVHINTGIGIEATRQFARDTVKTRGWKFLEYTAPIPKWDKGQSKTAYEALVRRWGFPGPAAHRFMYIYLKERAVAALVRDHKQYPRDKIMLVTGVRLSESVRHMGHVKPIIYNGSQLWVAPILEWTDETKTAWIKHKSLPQNPVVKTLCMSGECLCGAYAKPEERAEIRHAFPSDFEEIDRLERLVTRLGQQHQVWGNGSFRPRKSRLKTVNAALCTSCEFKHQGNDQE